MERNVTFDIMKGIGILLVIIGHTWDLPYLVINFIFSFHMPLFFIISGYFFKPRESIILIKKDCERLLLPYAVTGLVIILFYACFAISKNNLNLLWQSIIGVLYGSGSVHSSMISGDMPTIGPIWFLLALFWAKLIWNIYFYIISNKWIRFLMATTISVGATMVDRYLINLPLCLLPGMSAVVFLAIGELLKKHKLTWWGLLLLWGCWIVCVFHSQLYMVRCWYGHYPLDVLGALGGTLFIYEFSKYISKSRLGSSVLTWFGINSLAIMCFHAIDLDIHIMEITNIPNVWYISIPLRIAMCSTLTILLYNIKILRKIYSIKRK